MLSFASTCLAGYFGVKKKSVKLDQPASLCCGGESSSVGGRDEALKCPVCDESFNIVECVPCVLWCGHSLCKDCILRLPWAPVKLSVLPVQLPLFISCPWCKILSFRLVYRGNLKFPRKNYFLLWIVDSMIDEQVNSSSAFSGDHQVASPIDGKKSLGDQRGDSNLRRRQNVHAQEPNDDHSLSNNCVWERFSYLFWRSLMFIIHLVAKFPLVIIFLLIVFYAIPASAAILGFYALVTVLFALPSIFFLYFSYPCLDWLVREIFT